MDSKPACEVSGFEYIYYAGQWTEEERGLVAFAVAEVEDRLGEVPEPTPVLGKPWVCTRQNLSDRSLYMAHRAKRSKKVLTAHSAEELAMRIRERAA